jgi:hypothetical protein
MYILDDNIAREELRKMGFSASAIRRFCALRSQYGKNEMDQACLDKHHLEFARWLVIHRKLTEEIN